MLIVLEGPDGGGKSTLAATLAARFPGRAELIHHGPPDPWDRCPYGEYILPLDERALAVLSDDELVICDRLHVGDPVYAPYRPPPSGRPRLTQAGVLHTEMSLSALGAVKIMCLPPLEVVIRRVAERGDDFILPADLPRIHAEYATHAERYRYIVPPWDQDPAVTAAELTSRALAWCGTAAAYSSASAGTYTGSLTPSVIFAGDELGGDPAKGTRAGFTRPFTPKFPGSCSEWLLSALLMCDMLDNAGLVNSGHPGVDLAELARIRPAARWVALGRQAAGRLEKAGVPCRVTQHPQYAKRFRAGQHREYAAELAAAAGR